MPEEVAGLSYIDRAFTIGESGDGDDLLSRNLVSIVQFTCSQIQEML